MSLRNLLRSKKRGYLLLEALVAGVVLATTLGWLMVSAGRASQNTSMATKSAVSGSLVNERIQQVLARGHAVTAADFPSSPETLAIAGSIYTRTMTIGPSVAETWNSTVATPHLVEAKTITVQVDSLVNGATVTKTATVKVFLSPP